MVQECFVRPVIVERLTASHFTGGEWKELPKDRGEYRVTTLARADNPLPGFATTSVDSFPDDTWRHGPFDELEERQGHTAVWTGTLMLIWGGQDDSGLLATGHGYDPLLDSWTPLSVIDAPSARTRHVAVWTGSEMVIWGGQVGPPFTPYDVRTGGRFDPQADLWLSTSTIDAPTARREHTALWTGSDMLVWGGIAGPDGGPNDYPTDWGQYDLDHSTDNDEDGFSECDGDCDDASSTIFPGAPELCDNRDNDCDTIEDE